MKKSLKNTILYFSKWLGLFALSRYITRNGLRILCYHSFAMGDDEIQWRPNLFIRPETFRRRLDFLEKEKFPVLGLDQAINLMLEQKMPHYSTVISIDDGWYSIRACAHKILKEKSYPYTIYHTSYYSMKETPIFNLVVRFMFWKTKIDHFNMAELGTSMSGIVRFSDPVSLDQTIQQIIEYGDLKLDNPGRCALAKRLGESLGVDYAEIEKSRFLNLLTGDDIKILSADKVDFQLHSHRHRWPLEKQAALRELFENEAFLKPLTGNTSQHFCYPSGIWSYEQISYLVEAGIKSATIGVGGVNYHGTTPLHLLRRIVDGESNSQINFEAEMTGYMHILRKIKDIFLLKGEVSLIN
jgi:hypothetical protein